ncbi:MAG: amidohydrolase family protein [Thermoleophilia bacterium]
MPEDSRTEPPHRSLEDLETCDLECEALEPDRSEHEIAEWDREVALLAPFRERLRGLDVWDAHAHVGCDIDASRVTAAQLVRRLDLLGVRRAVVFPMNDPRQGVCFRHPNDLVWAAFQRYPDRLVPFFRLNPNFPSRKEYERRVGQGFRGIKLHPRSQSFRIAGPKVMEVYAWAEADGLPVLLHTGKGAGSIVEDIRTVIDAFPALRLILGHSALQELPGCCAQCANCDWVLFDTSTLDRDRLRELFRRTDPHKIAYGSDIPFGDQAEELVRVLEMAREAGLDREALALVLGGNIRRWVESPPPARGVCEFTEAPG